MKIIKKITLISLLLILALTASVTTASAFAVGEKFDNFSSRTVTMNPSVYFGKRPNGFDYGKLIYTAYYSVDGTRYDVFCMDPGKRTPSNLVISRVLLNEDENKAKEFGLATIITFEPEDGEFKTTGDQFIFAKGLALRIFYNGYAGFASSTSNQAAINALKSFSEDIKNGNTPSSITGPADIIEDATKLYKIGVEAAENYKPSKALDIQTEVIDVPDEEEIDNSTSDSSNSFGFGGSAGGSSSTGSGSVTKQVTKRKIIKVQLKYFDAEDGSFEFESLENGNVGSFSTSIVGMSTENSNDFSTYTTPLVPNANVFDTFSDAVEIDDEGTKNLTFYVAIEAKGTIEVTVSDGDCDEDCEDIEAKLNYKYDDPKVLIGAELHNASNATVSGSQRFLVAAKTQNTNEESIDIPISACNECRQDKCEPVMCKGDDCEYDATLPQICEDDVEVDENGLVEYKFLEAYSENGYNIVKCLLGAQNDASGNPYKLEDEDNAQLVSNNPYCSILCKEDYSIRVPYKQMVDEGRYFKITLSLKGQQDCYSTKFNKEQFDEDVKNKEKEIVDALNNWTFYYELVNLGTLEGNSKITDGETKYCEKVECSVDSSDASTTGCSKTINSNPAGTAWSVKQKKMNWGQDAKVHYYSFNELTGGIIQDNTNIPNIDGEDGVFGYIESQTVDGQECTFTDNNTPYALKDKEAHNNDDEAKKIITINNAKLEFWWEDDSLRDGKLKIHYKIQNTSSSDLDITYLVRGYGQYLALSVEGKKLDNLLFQKRVQIKVNANSTLESEFIVENVSSTITHAWNVQALSIVDLTTPSGSFVDPDKSNVSCTNDQEPCSIVTPQDDYDSKLQGYKDNLANAQARVEELVEELKEIVDLYNSCVGDKEYDAFSSTYQNIAFWNMIYKYDPKIKYSYDEPDPTTSRSKWIEDVKKTDCEGTSCDYLFSKNEEIFAEDCAEDGNIKCDPLGADGTFKSVFYESINGAASDSDPNDTHVNTYCIGDVNDDYSCKGTTLYSLDGSAYADEPFFTCSFDGTIFNCDNELHPVTKVNYIRKSALAMGDYDTRLVYYTGHQRGDIRIMYTDHPVLENYSQVPGLPVSADTPQGTYIYILNIENVGTFYNSGELGRIYGSDTKSLSTYVHDRFPSSPTSFYTTTGVGSNAVDVKTEIATNEYACTYKVSQSSCVDQNGDTHTIDECKIGTLDADWVSCQNRICAGNPGGYSCVDQFGSTHTIDECDIGGQDADWPSCQERLCPSGSSGGDKYCVKEAQSYYVCAGPSYDKDKCRKVETRDEALSQSSNNFNCCPNCEIICVGKCLYVKTNDTPNDGKVQFEFRTVSPQNMNPNSRKLGYNWDSANPTNKLAAQKAANTISEIEARAGAGSNPNINIEDISEYQLKVVMTPDMVTWIKEYNNEQATQGAYNNASLTCYNYDLDGYDEGNCKSSGYIWQDGKCIMSNIFCYSNFIDSLEENFADQVDAPHRSEAKNSAYENFKTYVGITSGEGSIITNDYWTIYKYDYLDINGDGIPDIGPSWK